MADKTENKVTNRKKIHFFREKKWIMAYWFKTSRKAQFTETYLWELWQKWFGNDFTGKSDERFQEILPWIREIRRTMTKDEIKKKDTILQIVILCHHILRSWQAGKDIM